MSESSSASSGSSKSSTPKTDNRGDFVESGGEDQLPEETKQPHLEPEAADTSNNITSQKNSNGKMPQVAPLPSGSPPLNMRKEVVGDTKSARKRSSKRHHRRTRSEEYAFHPPPPPSGYYPGMTSHYRMMPAKPHESFGDEPLESRRGNHNRIHSMPQVPTIPSPSMMVYPAPGMSPSGGALNPIQAYESGPLLPYPGEPQSGGSHRKRKSQAAARAPAPVMMMPPGTAMYGSFEDYTEELAIPPAPPSPRSSSPYSSEMFSPRGELMSLTGASPRQSRTTPPSSPSPSKRAIHTPPQHPRNPRRSPPGPAPVSALRTPGGTYRGPDDVRVSFSPHASVREGYSSSGRSPYTLQAGGADMTDSFNLADSSRDVHRGKKYRSPHSLRKMHMRQKSAQLFMEDTKGVKQPLRFKDVLFGVLFVVHLVGIAYLGMHYSRDAIMVNATHGELAINVWYRNVILIAALSGAFAVGVSTLTLILMTIIVKKLVQVSLILTIALSFAWGTIGIGVSPKNVVPITGIIALALSVGYAFVVWDRIPFAAANLMAGFHGVRKNAGCVLVAFAFQFLALVWSIYFTFVVIGVYDALLNGDLTLSKHATVFVYTMLFVSYFWTYSVLYVRTLLLLLCRFFRVIRFRRYSHYFRAFFLSACCSSNSSRDYRQLVVQTR